MPKGEFDDRFRCKATSKGTGERCRSRAVPGAEVCWKHGGAAKQVREAGQKRKQRGEAERQVERLGVKRRDLAPDAALLEELQRSVGYVDLLEAIVEREGEDGLTQWGMSGRTASAFWAMLEDQRKHLVATAAACIKAGIEERRVQLAEQQGRLMAEVIRTIVTGLGHDLQDDAVQRVVRPALQLMRSAA
jgi:hypothetical protein